MPSCARLPFIADSTFIAGVRSIFLVATATRLTIVTFILARLTKRCSIIHAAVASAFARALGPELRLLDEKRFGWDEHRS